MPWVYPRNEIPTELGKIYTKYPAYFSHEEYTRTKMNNFTVNAHKYNVYLCSAHTHYIYPIFRLIKQMCIK